MCVASSCKASEYSWCAKLKEIISTMNEEIRISEKRTVLGVSGSPRWFGCRVARSECEL